MEHIEMLNTTSKAAVAAAVAPTVPLLMLLETSIPGLSLMTRFLSDYLNIDLSQYIGLILLLVGMTTMGQSVANRLEELGRKLLMSSAEIRYNDEIYNYLMFWISKNDLSTRSRHIIAGTQTNSTQIWTNDESDVEDDEPELNDLDLKTDVAEKCRNWDRMKTLRFTPSAGSHWFRYKGHWMSFTRVQEREQGFYGSNLSDTICLSSFGWNPQILKNLLQEAQVAYLERDGNKTIIYRGVKQWGGSADDMDWSRCMSRPPRHMSTVVLDEAQKQLVLNDMREYLHPRTKKWYSNRGIPYRRGYLLHGPPGTGKTSLCFALAGQLHLRIYVISLNSKNMTEDGLASLFRALPSRCIVLLEDIDAAGLSMKRENEVDKKADNTEDQPTTPENTPATNPASPPTPPNDTVKGISLSGFLNIIDGVASSEGRVLVMTTNHIEKLDAALIRPGRVDLQVYFGRAGKAVLKGMFMAIYVNVGDECLDVPKLVNGDTESKKDSLAPKVHFDTPVIKDSDTFYQGGIHGHGKTEEEIEALAMAFSALLPEDVFSPAEIQGYLLRHKTDPQRAVDGVQDLIDSKENPTKT
jgi:chaperone BCS1